MEVRNRGKSASRKGKRLERYLASLFRLWGFDKCKTTRESSRLLDSCKVDLDFIPFLIQAKSGYKRDRPRYDVSYRQTKEGLRENFPENHEVHNKPIVLVHKINGYKKENWTWTFAHEDISKILEEYFYLKRMASLLKDETDEEVRRNKDLL